jgi:hypothetical protein
MGARSGSNKLESPTPPKDQQAHVMVARAASIHRPMHMPPYYRITYHDRSISKRFLVDSTILIGRNRPSEIEGRYFRAKTRFTEDLASLPSGSASIDLVKASVHAAVLALGEE